MRNSTPPAMTGIMGGVLEVRDEYREWHADGGVLAQIGRALFDQPTKLTVSLPRDLAKRALASWQRSYEGPLGEESSEERKIRHRAASLGLIGLSVERSGLGESDDVVVELDAWYVEAVLEAADELGLLPP
jgi:hypothetical protein